MRTLVIELRKSKRTGVIPLMIAVGIAGAAYAFINLDRLQLTGQIF